MFFRFFSRYQRFLIIVISVFVITSFFCFGLFRINAKSLKKDEVAFILKGGKSIYQSTYHALKVFLAHDDGDYYPEAQLLPNLLNDGMIVREFIESPLAMALIRHHEDAIASELKERHSREKHFVPYAHPSLSALSPTLFWDQQDPQFKLALSRFRYATSATDLESLQDRFTLFLTQKKMPPAEVKSLLLHYEKNLGVHDSLLPYKDLALFGYHSFTDWFGETLLSSIIHSILQGAEIAKEKGFRVSKKEVRAYIEEVYQSRLTKFLRQYQLNTIPSSLSFDRHLMRFGMSEKELRKWYKAVLLFRKLFHGIGNSAFIDTVLPSQFIQRAEQEKSLVIYQLPSAFHFQTRREIYLFHTYLSRITKRKEATDSLLFLPNTFFEAEEVMKTSPSLVQKQYVVQQRQVKKSHVSRRIRIQAIREWIFDAEHWKEIKAHFLLGELEAESIENAFFALNQERRVEIENYARQQIMDNHLDWIKEALYQQSSREEILIVRKKGGCAQLPGSEEEKKTEILLQWLDSAPLQREMAEDESDTAVFSFNGEDFYHFTVIEKSPAWEMVLFQDALRENILDELLEEDTKQYYDSLGAAFLPSYCVEENGQRKSFGAIKNDIVHDLFYPLIQQIANDYLSDHSLDQTMQEKARINPDFWAPYYFYGEAKEKFNQLYSDGTPSPLLEEEKNPGEEEETVIKLKKPFDLANQWQWEQKRCDVKRNESHPFINTTYLFQQSSLQSAVQIPHNGNIHFFIEQPQKQGVKNEAFSSARKLIIEQLQNAVALEQRQILFQSLIIKGES